MNDTPVTYLEQYDPAFVLGLLVLCATIETMSPEELYQLSL